MPKITIIVNIIAFCHYYYSWLLFCKIPVYYTITLTIITTVVLLAILVSSVTPAIIMVTILGIIVAINEL